MLPILKEKDNSEEDHDPEVDVEFYPLRWLLSGYRLPGITREYVELLENRKVQYMKLHGYKIDENDELYAGRTSRLEVEDEHSGKYSCPNMSRGCS